MKETRVERAKKLVDAIRKDMTSGPVCDSVFECEGWSKFFKIIIDQQVFCAFQSGSPKYPEKGAFLFCPWCGKKLDWENWERLKR